MELLVMLFIGVLILNLLTLSSVLAGQRSIHIHHNTPARPEGPGCLMIVLGFFAVIIILAVLAS
jgi:hypothetical protein